jgi:hypothetical protein
MVELHKTIPVHNFVRPEGLVEKTICSDNGLVPVVRSAWSVTDSTHYALRTTLLAPQLPASCPHTLTELFITGTEPARFDDWHQSIALDRRNSLRAGAGCPMDFVTFQTFTL